MLHVLKKSASLASVVLVVSCNALCVNSVKSSVSPLSLILTVEICKFSLSALVLGHSGDVPQIDWTHFLSLSVPGLIYCFNNVLVFHVIRLIGPVNLQLFGQTKIIFLGILSRFFFGRHLEALQWSALVILTCAVANESISSDWSWSIPVHGVLLALLLSFLSSLAGVFTEYRFKSNTKKSVWENNLQLYFHGIWINIVSQFAFEGAVQNPLSIFKASGWIVPVTVLVQSTAGMSIGWLLQFHSSIVKAFVGIFAAIAVALFMAIFYGQTLSIRTVLSLILVSNSVFLYNFSSMQHQVTEYTESQD